MKSILLIENDPQLAEKIRSQLEAERFEVKSVLDGNSGLAALGTATPDLLILDDSLPDLPALEVLGRVRRDDLLKRLALLMLTEPCQEEELVHKFEMGTDDLVIKPFSPRELLARVRALLWRAHTTTRFRNALQFGNLIIDRDFNQLVLSGRPVATSVLEFRLLCLLASNPGCIFSRDQLAESVWGPENLLNPRSVDVSIRRLREKIEKKPNDPQLLRTVYGAGYVFAPTAQCPQVSTKTAPQHQESQPVL
jgi:DNA-binding response OmpR family regulator